MSPLSDLRRVVHQAVTGLRNAGPVFFSLDLNPVPRDWKHVTKVDPEGGKRLPLLYPLYLQHTDAVSVGGSSRVTPRNTEGTFHLLELVHPTVFHEPSDAQHVTEATRERAAFLAIPEVLNGDIESLVGTLGEGITYLYDNMIPDLLDEKLPAGLMDPFKDRLTDFTTSWVLSNAVFEAYIIQNPESAAAEQGGVSANDVLSPSKARERAMVADRHLDSEIVYVEYSGTYGGEEAEAVLETVGDALNRSRLWYGGGIDSREQTENMLNAGADTIVVGDIFHDIASEERQIVEQLDAQLGPTPTADELEAWVVNQVPIQATVAANYLQTIPSVRNPETLTKRYLLSTLSVYLNLTSSEEIGKESSSIEEQNHPLTDTFDFDGERLLRDALPEDKTTPESYVSDVVSPAVLRTATSPLPVHHLSLWDDSGSTKPSQ